jgi:hypothetical protein
MAVLPNGKPGKFSELGTPSYLQYAVALYGLQFLLAKIKFEIVNQYDLIDVRQSKNLLQNPFDNQ